VALVAGIDPSARRIAIVATELDLRIETAQAYNLYAKGESKQTMESLGRAVDAVEKFIEWADMVCPHGPRYAWVEDPLIGRGGSVTTMKQSYVGGIVRGILVRSSFQVYGVNVSTWKARVCGTGSADKARVGHELGVKWPKVSRLVGGDVDLTDAGAICLYGQATLGTGAAITAPLVAKSGL
jgi:Holliday junction resolvasome RuvABC endonuclease subunit